MIQMHKKRNNEQRKTTIKVFRLHLLQQPRYLVGKEIAAQVGGLSHARHYLKAGYVYPLKIKEYINSADLFILCWSKNAAESDYVQLERQQALTLAFPQKDMEQATLSIHPISIEPHADYPSDMKEVYNFEEI